MAWKQKVLNLVESSLLNVGVLLVAKKQTTTPIDLMTISPITRVIHWCRKSCQSNAPNLALVKSPLQSHYCPFFSDKEETKKGSDGRLEFLKNSILAHRLSTQNTIVTVFFRGLTKWNPVLMDLWQQFKRDFLSKLSPSTPRLGFRLSWPTESGLKSRQGDGRSMNKGVSRLFFKNLINQLAWKLKKIKGKLS